VVNPEDGRIPAEGFNRHMGVTSPEEALKMKKLALLFSGVLAALPAGCSEICAQIPPDICDLLGLSPEQCDILSAVISKVCG
jgi:hypothetical protein